MFIARFDRRIFYYSSKTDSSWGCVAKVTASHLLVVRPLHWKERGRIANVGGTEGARGGREGGSDDVRQGRGEGE